MDGDGLVCPSCAREHPAHERFCRDCGMPLVHSHGGEQDVGDLRERARKVEPRYTEGPLVKVALAQNEPQAQFIANLLLEEGIPSVLRNVIGGYSPTIGPREVMVPESAAQAAREALAYRRG